MEEGVRHLDHVTFATINRFTLNGSVGLTPFSERGFCFLKIFFYKRVSIIPTASTVIKVGTEF